jgi:dihydropyrimidinase
MHACLWSPQALSQGILQLVATDHAVFTKEQKAAGRQDFRKIPNGVNGLEERMHVVWELMVNSGENSVTCLYPGMREH